MARVTVEDCIKKVPNRFELVLGAAQRARELESGAPETIITKDKKHTVRSLREIAAGAIDPKEMLDKIVMASQRLAGDEVEEDDEVSFDNVKVIGTEDIQFQTISQQEAEDQLDSGEASEQEVGADDQVVVGAEEGNSEDKNEEVSEIELDPSTPKGEE